MNWQQGSLIEIEITSLSNSGDGVGRYDNRVVFVPNTVTRDRVLVRLVRVKPKYAYAQLQEILEYSPHRIRPHCIVADKCGGCQWQHITPNYQIIAKQEQLTEALTRIGGFTSPPVNPILSLKADNSKETNPNPEIRLRPRDPNAHCFNYRNKVSYPLGIGQQGQVQAGYYRQGSHNLINLSQCPVQDAHFNPLLAEIKQDLQERGWSIYNEHKHQGQLRHLCLRIGRRTGEMLLTLVSTDDNLPGIEDQLKIWFKRYPRLVGIALNLNPERGNAIFGKETRILRGKGYLRERFAGLELQLRPDTFFQINTEAAEALLRWIEDNLDLQGTETLLDAYCGIGTFTLPLAKRVKKAIGIEIQPESVEQARINAQNNRITNVTFHAESVETFLSQLKVIPDIVLLDPPRKGCDRAVIETLLQQQPQRIVYISCNPATLARDLQILCATGLYQLKIVQPADFFPQTPHIESVAILTMDN